MNKRDSSVIADDGEQVSGGDKKRSMPDVVVVPAPAPFLGNPLLFTSDRSCLTVPVNTRHTLYMVVIDAGREMLTVYDSNDELAAPSKYRFLLPTSTVRMALRSPVCDTFHLAPAPASPPPLDISARLITNIDREKRFGINLSLGHTQLMLLRLKPVYLSELLKALGTSV